MTVREFERDYWRYYRMLEDKFMNTLLYVELSQSNFTTYSNEFAHLIQTIGAELDSFFKVYCGFAAKDRKTITEYAGFVLSDWSGIVNQIVKTESVSLRLQPFDNWNAAQARQSIVWWDAFDSIKHSRVGNIAMASLENTLNILAALYMLEMKYHKKLADATNYPDVIKDRSKLFIMDNWQTRYLSINDAVFETTNGTDIVLDGGGATA